jgi:N-formylglutamate amidohydrolase
MILHIPRASRDIPWYEGYILLPDRLSQEMHLLTDHYTDELFRNDEAIIIQSHCSRIFWDMERFEDDASFFYLR